MPPASGWPDPVRPVSGESAAIPAALPGTAERGCRASFGLLGWLPKS